MSGAGFAEAFCAVIALAEKLGVSRINELEGCWTHRVDAEWWIAVNGHSTPTTCTPPAGVPVDVPPFAMYVEFLGWPAGILNPRGGTFAKLLIQLA